MPTGSVISIVLGLILIGTACYYLFYGLDRFPEKKKVAVSIVALRVSSWLAIGGLILVFLGILNLMRIIPWWS